MIFDPHDYQKYCIAQMINKNFLALFLDMGLGKTAIALSAISELKRTQTLIDKVLVIAPKKVAELVWAAEANKWDHLADLSVVKVLGSLPQRVKALNTPADIYVINRDNVVWLVKYYEDKWPFNTVLVDELSSFKNSQSLRFKALKSVRGYVKRLYGLTGTPAPRGLEDLWAQVYLLDEGARLGKHFTQYRNQFFDPDRRNGAQIYSYKPKRGSGKLIHAQIADICISMKAEDYLKLPDCISVTVPVVLNKKSQAAYDDLESQMLLDIGDVTVDASSAAALSSKLLQLGNGAVYDAERSVHEVHDCKIDALMELVEGLNGQPALVFYNFKHDLPRIKNALAKTNLTVRELKTGQDQADWNARKIDILLAHPASAAYGLNLQQGGNHIIWFGLNWSLELYQQAIKRLHRQGQTEKVIVHHLVVSGGIDEDVMAALLDKGSTQDALLSALKARIKRAGGSTGTAVIDGTVAPDVRREASPGEEQEPASEQEPTLGPGTRAAQAAKKIQQARCRQCKHLVKSSAEIARFGNPCQNCYGDYSFFNAQLDREDLEECEA